MGKIVGPEFFTRPPLVLSQNAAQERVIKRYESLLESQVRVLASLCMHAGDLVRGKSLKRVAGGFILPHKWQADLPMTCDLRIDEDPESGEIVVRLADASPRPSLDTTGWIVPDEQKRMEDEELA